MNKLPRELASFIVDCERFWIRIPETIAISHSVIDQVPA